MPPRAKTAPLVAEPRYVGPGRRGRPAYYTIGNTAYFGGRAAAKFLGVGRTTFYRWVEQFPALLPPYVIGSKPGTQTWRQSDLETFRDRERTPVLATPPEPAVAANA